MTIKILDTVRWWGLKHINWNGHVFFMFWPNRQKRICCSHNSRTPNLYRSRLVFLLPSCTPLLFDWHIDNFRVSWHKLLKDHKRFHLWADTHLCLHNEKKFGFKTDFSQLINSFIYLFIHSFLHFFFLSHFPNFFLSFKTKKSWKF